MKHVIPAVALLICLFVGASMAADLKTAAGNYINKGDTKEYIQLYPDGAFHLKQRKRPADLNNPFLEVTGKYSIAGDIITLVLPDGGEGSMKITENTLEDDQGAKWVKEGSDHRPVERPKRQKWW